jgi:uncharacterized protein (TIGR03435 family)
MSLTSFVRAALVVTVAQISFAQSLEVVNQAHHAGGAPRGIVRMRPDGVSGENVTLKQLIRHAYDLQDVQISGPAWIATEAYSLEAKAGNRMTPEQGRMALQRMLADRFKLTSHQEKKDLPGYRLVLAETGHKLRDPREEEAFNAALGGKPPFKEGLIGIFTSKDLPGFAERLSRGIGRLVVDTTGISGRYWFQLEWAPDKDKPAGDGPSLRRRNPRTTRLETRRGQCTVGGNGRRFR